MIIKEFSLRTIRFQRRTSGFMALRCVTGSLPENRDREKDGLGLHLEMGKAGNNCSCSSGLADQSQIYLLYVAEHFNRRKCIGPALIYTSVTLKKRDLRNG